MQVWFSEFIRGRVFSVLFCILGFGLTIYLSSRLGILIEGFAGPWPPTGNFFDTDSVLHLYAHLCEYPQREQENTELIQPMWNLFSFFPSTVICFFLFDLIRSLCGAYDGRLYLIPLLLAAVVSAYGFVHDRKIFVKEYSIPLLPAASTKDLR